MSAPITMRPDVMGGVACIRDTRIPVSVVLDHLAGGYDIDQTIALLPSLERADVLAALRFAVTLCDSFFKPAEPDPAEELAQGLMHDEAAALRDHEQWWIERYQSGEVRASDVPKDLLPAVLASGAPRVSYTERRKQQRTEGPLGSRWKGVP